MNQDDGQLLRDFVEGRSDGAFEEVVRRHVGMVFAAAVRQVKDRALAEDVTQAVFMVLVKKAGGLRMKTVGGWLLKVTRYAAIDVMRKERRHRNHEQAAAMERSEVVEASDDWRELLPVLDEAMSRLGDGDRDAVVLRYFEGRGIAEIAGQMGVGEEAARKRVSRGVEKLRGIILRKGVVMTGAAVVGAIASNANAGVSAGLVGTILKGAGGCGTGAGVAGSIAKGAMNLIAMAQVKLAAVVVGVILLGSGGAVMTTRIAGWQRPMVRQAIPVANTPAWQIQFDQVYQVKDGEDVQWIEQKDFPAARAEFGRPYFAGGNVQTDSSLRFFWDVDTAKARYWGASIKLTMGDVLHELGIHRYELETADALRSLDLGGDWIFRYRPDAAAEAVQAERQAAINLIGARMHRSLSLSSSKQEREVIVATGVFGTLPENDNGVIKVMLSDMAGGGSGTIKGMLGTLADIENIHVIDETESSEDEVRWVYRQSMPVANGAGGANKPLDAAVEVDRTLADLTRQIGIEFKREKRVVTVWTLAESQDEVFIGGDRVARSGVYKLRDGGLSLSQLLHSAGADASAGGVRIVRRIKGEKKEQVINISGDDVVANYERANVMLQSNDVVMVMKPGEVLDPARATTLP